MGGEVRQQVRRWIVLMLVKPHMSDGNKLGSFLPQSHIWNTVELPSQSAEMCFFCVCSIWAPVCVFAFVQSDNRKISANRREQVDHKSEWACIPYIHVCKYMHTLNRTQLAAVSWACVAQCWDVEWSRKCVSHEGMCLCWLQSPITSQRENRHQHRFVCSPSHSFSSKPSTWSFLTSGSPRFLLSHNFPLYSSLFPPYCLSSPR